VRRRAMASSWFGGDDESLIRYDYPGGRHRFARGWSGTEGSLPAAVATGVEQAPRLKRWLGMLRDHRIKVWHDASHNAVVSVELLSTRKNSTQPEAFRVDCCPSQVS